MFNIISFASNDNIVPHDDIPSDIIEPSVSDNILSVSDNIPSVSDIIIEPSVTSDIPIPNKNLFVNTKKTKIDDDDEDEDNEDKLYILSINNIPFFYNVDLISLRLKMWNIANSYIKPNNLFEFENRSIISNDMNEIRIESKLDFFIFNYSNNIYTLKIDYVLPY